MNYKSLTRRSFIKKSGLGLGGVLSTPDLSRYTFLDSHKNNIPVNAHLWVYASKFPPHWDCTPILDTVFADLRYAGIEGVEIMEAQLRHQDSVSRINDLIKKNGLPVSGSSYGVGFNMWDQEQHESIMKDIHLVVPRLAKVGGKTFGISVGSKKEPKSEAELDAQANILGQIRKVCQDHGILPNLHNHTYEVENDMHDLKGTLSRIPDFKLGPDLNWLIRGGVEPVDFIQTYGDQIVYLHIRDQYNDGTWTEYLGQGTTDFKSIAEALKAVNFKGQAAIELAFPNEFEPENELREDWKMSRSFVRQTFGW
ncbi:sugar phosphate isomerase/epimerase family protein [Pareuzebyella sediminis]|uniref:sugar phosphate isomerase/epimerase family protein n=1 Tax=Pareuzebyella sediminis TaxID=2607998 RepID=UPI0011EC8C9E|nr:TIM barrel protein [Pareuzebyella sediminis]